MKTINVRKTSERQMRDDYIDINYLLKKAKEAGFDSIDEFVRANLKHLPQWKQEVFRVLEDAQ